MEAPQVLVGCILETHGCIPAIDLQVPSGVPEPDPYCLLKLVFSEDKHSHRHGFAVQAQSEWFTGDQLPRERQRLILQSWRLHQTGVPAGQQQRCRRPAVMQGHMTWTQSVRIDLWVSMQTCTSACVSAYEDKYMRVCPGMWDNYYGLDIKCLWEWPCVDGLVLSL